MFILLGLLVSDVSLADGFSESMRPENLAAMSILLLTGLVQLALFGKHRRPTDGSLALLCAGMLVGCIVYAGIWPLDAHFRATTYAAIVPLLLYYLQTLMPRRWLSGMVDFTWAYVIPYWVIVFVYPPQQLVPILPVMEIFSYFSLATTLVAAHQARSEGRPYGVFLLLTLVFFLVGLMFPPTRVWAPGFFVCFQVWTLVLSRRTRP